MLTAAPWKEDLALLAGARRSIVAKRFSFVALIILALGPSVRAQHIASSGCMENGHIVWYDHPVTTCGSPAPSTGSSAVDTLSPVMQQAMTNFFTWLFSSNPQQDQQRKAFLAEAERRRVEAEQQRILEEQRRRDELFRRLSRELKLDGLPGLYLKGMESSPALKLKGLEGATQGSSELKLKLGGDDGSKPYGIPGLPGIYTGGARAASANAAGVQGSQDNSSNKNNELHLKLGDEEPKATANQATDKAAQSPVAAAQPESGIGIPGLPGVYLDGANQGDATKLAAAAQKLSGPDREVAEETALDAASRNPALTAPSQDPSVNSFQQARSDYEQARQAQASAADVYKTAQTRHDANQSVLDLARSEVEKGDATGAAPTVAGKQEALANLVAGAKTDEEAWDRAKQGFDTATTNLVFSRTKAVNALAALGSAGTTVVDLRGVNQPQIVRPNDPKGPVPKAAVPPPDLIPAGSGPSKCRAPSGAPPFSLANQDKSHAAVEARIAELNRELKGIQELLRRLSKTEAMNQGERAAWTKEMDDAWLRAVKHGGEMLLAGSLEKVDSRFEKEEVENERALAFDRDELHRQLGVDERALHNSYINSREQRKTDLRRLRAEVQISKTAWDGVHAASALADNDTTKLEKGLEVLHTALNNLLNNPEVQRVLNYDKAYASWFSVSKDFVDSMYDLSDVGVSWYFQAAENKQTDTYLNRVAALNAHLKNVVSCLNEAKEQLVSVPAAPSLHR